MVDVQSPEDYIAHFGVKGMKWGKRKVRSAKASSSPKRYSNSAQVVDATLLGRSAPDAVKKNIAKGDSVRKARLKQFGKTAAVSTALIGGSLVAGHLLSKHGARKVSSFPSDRQNNPREALMRAQKIVPQPSASGSKPARATYVPKRPGTTRPTNISPTAFQTKVGDILKADTVQVRKIQTEIGKIQKSGSPLNPTTLNQILKASQGGQADNGAQIIKTLQNYRYFTE